MDENIELLKMKGGKRCQVMESDKENDRLQMLSRQVASDILNSQIYTPMASDTLLYEMWVNNECQKITFDTLTSQEKEFYENKICKHVSESMDLCIKTQYQDNNLWKKERKLRITTCNAYSLITYVNNKSPNWPDKIEKYLNSNFQGNEDTRHGLLMEESALKC